MKYITANQLRFAAILFLFTVPFRLGLSRLLDAQMFTTAWVVASIYAVAVFITGWILGRKDHESLPLYDIGFRFHLTTYIICNAVAEILFLLDFNSRYENINVVHLTAIYWGVFLVLHFIAFLATRRYAIKGISKSEIFE
ncbi:MAG: hypothetical protein RBT74_02675 [Tenuifilaceae bacterium]|jgi:hypothetical protein|nr:hypothetical protein [Tenuifilaceae bacterium]